MVDPQAPRAPFDQGLFLTHFNKGREAYEAHRYAEAERELEEAYLLRPRDAKVLNLLGLAYFKLERFEKAEEIYRKLVTESPDVATLHYNLGLICFKSERLDEAESAFLKALELSGDNPKMRFYLGAIYERQRRFQDAIFQYRQAGAHILVRRVEDKLAAGPSPVRPAAPPSTPQAPPAARVPLAPAAPPAGPARGDDTARVRPDDVRAALRREAAGEAGDELLPGARVQPIGRPLLAEDAPARVPSDTARFRLDGATPAPEPFRVLENGLVEVTVAERVFIRPGTLYSYTGAFTFWVKERRAQGHPALAIATGKGRLMLRDRGREVTFLRVGNEPLTVEPEHLLAAEATLQPRFVSVGETPGADFLVFDGRGLVALSVSGRPLALSVEPDLPVSVPAASVITWSGALTANLVNDPQLLDTAAPAGSPNRAWLRFAGRGRVLVEQTRG